MKDYRQRTIKKILSKTKIRNQDELLRFLSQEGITTTQATLSRDLKELKVVKFHSHGGGYYLSLPVESGQVLLDDPKAISGIIRLELSGQIGLIRTRPGYAGMLASVVDSHSMESVMGTVAGDDTILIAMRSGFAPETVIEELSVFITDIKSKSVIS